MPQPTIIGQTERLYLRRLQVADAAQMYDLNADPEVIRYTGDPPFASVDDARAFLEGYDHYDQHGFGRWAVIRKADHAFVGWSGVKWNEDEEADIGFRFFKKEWGKGYATESAREALKLGFEQWNLPYIIGRVVPANLASQRVLEKIGMKHWKVGTCGPWKDALYYRMDRLDFGQ